MSSSSSLSYGILRDIQPLLEMLAWSFLFVVGVRTLTTWYVLRRMPYDGSERTLWTSLLDFALIGHKPSNQEKLQMAKTVQQSTTTATTTNANTYANLMSITFAFVGLQASFLTWGWIQERIMVTAYGGVDKFPSSNMLVLSNRVFAIIFSFLVIQYKKWGQENHGKKHTAAPFFAFAFPAIANTVSSFAAYESLRFMSFPMSTVCKTLKIIPTMLMGTLIHRKKYSTQEYASASMITCGAAMFAVEFGAGGLDVLFEKTDKIELNLVIPGLLLMATYLAVDAFTSNLQTLLFKEYLLTPYECMLGINVFSIFISVFNLAQSNQLLSSIAFLIQYPAAFFDVFLLALSSAAGQLFIYYTIERHGPVTFTIIQLTRQLLSILLSSWSFGHDVSGKAWIGIVMTFTGIFAMNYKKGDSQPSIDKPKNKGQ